MLLTPDPTTPSSSGCDLDAVAAGFESRRTTLAGIARQRQAAEEAWRQARSRAEKAGSEAVQGLESELATPDPAEDPAAGEAVTTAWRQRWLDRLGRCGSQARRSVQQALERRLGGLEQELRRAQEESARIPPELEAEMEVRRRELAAVGRELQERLTAVEETFARICRRAGVKPAPPTAEVPSAFPNWDLTRRIDLVRDQLAEAEAGLTQITASSAVFFAGPTGLVVAGLVVVVLHALALAGLDQFGLLHPALPWASGSCLAILALALLHALLRRRLVARRLLRIQLILLPLPDRLKLLQQASLKELDPKVWLQRRLERVVAVDQAERSKVLREETDARLAELRRREARLRNRIEEACRRELALARQEAERKAGSRRARLEAAMATAKTGTTAELARIDQAWQEERGRLEDAWRKALDGLRSWAEELGLQVERQHPGWDAASWQIWLPPPDFAAEIPIGRLSLPFASLAESCGASGLPLPESATLGLPACLAFPGRGSLLIRGQEQNRAAALALANRILLRAITAFPAGRVRLTLVDPVGLGDSWADLLDLGDHDDALLSGGVLSEQPKIEQGLDDLCTHLERVIQKHLRGRYASLAEYNREAGEMREPVRLLAVAGFPNGFAERGIERLATIARSGARCGVHVLLLHEGRKPLPAGIDSELIGREWVVLKQEGEGFALERKELAGFAFAGEAAPPASLVPRLVEAVGQAAHRARRIEVPFSILAPAAGREWSGSTASLLSIPVGKRGAEGLQLFELGRGTCQHALVGGRTGSGKSTLFHVLVTSAALWFHPRELELHLIDFKKGVEFKAFANHKLPHARVIAIESDREFGLSVLRHLDAELTRRGDAYRQVGAQDVAAYRRARPDQEMPRILLLIDEFQEFFTEDDSVARDAALLLDRFVRQGRAFGLHVVLGSQTLGGSYSLAKSSIGQMGVRIALPCNETDAHLLLHEDNDAARLLDRPGDGIYNDRAGLAEGNSPFQVCWLGEEEEGRLLDLAAAKAAAEGWRPARPAVVFEGDRPARIEDEPALAALLEQAPGPADARIRAWVGQASSLRGAAEVALPGAAGGNLLLVGQHREAAVATLGAVALSLAARHPRGGIRLPALDGEDGDGPFAATWARLAPGLGEDSARREPRDTASLLGGLCAELDRRQAGAPERSPIVLTVFALQRLRQLRPDDDLGLAAGGESASEQFARLLANGPEYAIHVLLWCDSLASAQRGLGRKSLRDCDTRILFQMSAADSTELCDDDGASRLGLHTALLVVPGEGRREKFRPYGVPDAAFLATAVERLRKP